MSEHPPVTEEMVARPSALYVDSQIISHAAHGGYRIGSDDDVPEELVDALGTAVPQVFDGHVTLWERMTEEQREAHPSAQRYDEFWLGNFRPATNAEIAAFFGLEAAQAVAPPPFPDGSYEHPLERRLDLKDFSHPRLGIKSTGKHGVPLTTEEGQMLLALLRGQAVAPPKGLQAQIEGLQASMYVCGGQPDYESKETTAYNEAIHEFGNAVLALLRSSPAAPATPSPTRHQVVLLGAHSGRSIAGALIPATETTLYVRQDEVLALFERASSGSTGAPALDPAALCDRIEALRISDRSENLAIRSSQVGYNNALRDVLALLAQPRAGSTGGAPSWEVAGAAPATPETSREPITLGDGSWWCYSGSGSWVGPVGEVVTFPTRHNDHLPLSARDYTKIAAVLRHFHGDEYAKA